MFRINLEKAKNLVSAQEHHFHNLPLNQVYNISELIKQQVTLNQSQEEA
jgi:hypothetical protein